MADNTQQDDGGLQGLLNSLGRSARTIGHFWAPGLVDAPPAQQPTQMPPPQKPATPAPIAPPITNLTQQQLYKQQAAKNPEAFVMGYRYNENPKLKSLIETMPTYYSIENMKPYMSAYKTAVKQYGLPNIGEKTLGAMLLAEGREDWGYNHFNQNNPKAMELYSKLRSDGFDHETAGFVAAIKDKQDVAKRLNIPFPKAWTGTGKTKFGTTGNDYVRRIQNNTKALEHEKNKAVRDFIRDSIARLEAQNAEEVQAAKGGSIHKALQGGSKMI